MGWFKKLRENLAGPPHIQDGGAEGAADLHEEFGTADRAREDIEGMEHGYAGGGPVGGLAGRDAAEIAESEIDSP